MTRFRIGSINDPRQQAKVMDDKMSIARRRRHCAYDDDYLEKVVSKIIHA